VCRERKNRETDFGLCALLGLDVEEKVKDEE
jgi:hypothetical protein